MLRLALRGRMKRINHLYKQIYAFENLHEAYKQARKGKRFRNDVLKFTHNLEENLITIQNELIWKTYRVGRYREFFVHDPKKRLIMALPFKDRVVQWAIYRILNPLLEKSYINNSYACRVGYGSLRAVRKIQYWMRKMHRAGQEIYVLKMDVSKYFYRVDHDILVRILQSKIKDRDLLWLLETIIRCEHTDFGLGVDDTGVTGAKVSSVGMPIGNLTSQMFANLYLNELDQHCKQDLRLKWYARYMDDVLVLSGSKTELRRAWFEIDAYLRCALRLRLNGKTCIRSITQGVEFCGFRIWPEKMRLKKKTALKMRRAVKGIIKHRPASALASLASYKGLAEHVSGDGLARIVSDAIAQLRN